jgi:hypothetical protein
MADRMVFFKTELGGGGAEALDNIDGDDRGDGNPLQDGDGAIVLYAGDYYLYILDDDLAGVEDSPNAIAPDTHPGDKRWVLQTIPFVTYGTASTPPSAGTTPDGTIYLKYTA